MNTEPGTPPGIAGPDAALLELAREIHRDLAHEMRGPVQAAVISVEVARRQAADQDRAGVAERLAIVEQEVRRLHHMADAFLLLFRPLPAERRVFDVASALRPAEPLLLALARAARTGFRLQLDPATPPVCSVPEALTLAFVRAAVAANGACGPQGEVVAETSTTSRTVDLAVTARAPDGGSGTAACPGIESAVRAANLWLQPGGGTAERLPGSDPRVSGVIRIRLPRADIA